MCSKAFPPHPATPGVDAGTQFSLYTGMLELREFSNIPKGTELGSDPSVSDSPILPSLLLRRAAYIKRHWTLGRDGQRRQTGSQMIPQYSEPMALLCLVPWYPPLENGDASHLPLGLTWLGRGREPPEANPSHLPSLGWTDPAIQFTTSPPSPPPPPSCNMTPEQREGDFENDLSSDWVRGALGGECRVDSKGDRRTQMKSDGNGFQGKGALGVARHQSGRWRLSPPTPTSPPSNPTPPAPVLIRPSISS